MDNPSPCSGAVAQLGERRVRNAKARGSIPLGSTNLSFKTFLRKFTARNGGFFVSENANVSNGLRGMSHGESGCLPYLSPPVFTPSLLLSAIFSTTC